MLAHKSAVALAQPELRPRRRWRGSTLGAIALGPPLAHPGRGHIPVTGGGHRGAGGSHRGPVAPPPEPGASPTIAHPWMSGNETDPLMIEPPGTPRPEDEQAAAFFRLLMRIKLQARVRAWIARTRQRKADAAKADGAPRRSATKPFVLGEPPWALDADRSSKPLSPISQMVALGGTNAPNPALGQRSHATLNPLAGRANAHRHVPAAMPTRYSPRGAAGVSAPRIRDAMPKSTSLPALSGASVRNPLEPARGGASPPRAARVPDIESAASQPTDLPPTNEGSPSIRPPKVPPKAGQLRLPSSLPTPSCAVDARPARRRSLSVRRRAFLGDGARRTATERAVASRAAAPPVEFPSLVRGKRAASSSGQSVHTLLFILCNERERARTWEIAAQATTSYLMKRMSMCLGLSVWCQNLYTYIVLHTLYLSSPDSSGYTRCGYGRVGVRLVSSGIGSE